MRKTDESEPKAVAKQIGTSLLRDGKSTRLLQLREKALGLGIDQTNHMSDYGATESDQRTDFELTWVKQMIDGRLQEIMSRFPADKKQHYFKIRYGMTPEQLKKMSVADICSVLQLKQFHFADMKRMADLDYNGRPIGKPPADN